ncbi:MAG: metal transporter [Paralcaligenes sp.]
MKRSLIFFLVISIALLAGAGWYVYGTLYTSAGVPVTSTPKAQAQHVQIVNGETVVTIAPDVQRSSHIDIVTLVAPTIAPERKAYATIIDLQPLFDLRSRLIAAQTNHDSAQAQALASRAQYTRNRVLFKDNQNVSQKSLLDSQAAMTASEAKLQAAEATESELQASITRRFGETLAKVATTRRSDLFQQLSTGRAVVLRVTLPTGDNISPPVHITVDTFDNRRVPADKLSMSPQVDPLIQGHPYLYVVQSALPVGAHITAYIPSGIPSAAAVLIPVSAVIWYGGQQWAYVQTAADRFTRRDVKPDRVVDRGFIVTRGFIAGNKVVINGAQLLLSEELRPQGIATQCKDPPECDG